MSGERMVEEMLGPWTYGMCDVCLDLGFGYDVKNTLNTTVNSKYVRG